MTGENFILLRHHIISFSQPSQSRHNKPTNMELHSITSFSCTQINTSMHPHLAYMSTRAGLSTTYISLPTFFSSLQMWMHFLWSRGPKWTWTFDSLTRVIMSDLSSQAFSILDIQPRNSTQTWTGNSVQVYPFSLVWVGQVHFGQTPTCIWPKPTHCHP